jgi:hypothetical protein
MKPEIPKLDTRNQEAEGNESAMHLPLTGDGAPSFKEKSSNLRVACSRPH